MRRPLLVALAVIGHFALPCAAEAQTAEKDAVLATVRAFHDALVRGDSAAAIRQLALDVQVLETGGLESLADYRSHHLPGDMAFAKAVPSERATPTVTILGDVAWVVGMSKTTGTYRDRPVNSTGAELMVLSRTPDGWRIRAIHWSSRAIRSP